MQNIKRQFQPLDFFFIATDDNEVTTIKMYTCYVVII